MALVKASCWLTALLSLTAAWPALAAPRVRAAKDPVPTQSEIQHAPVPGRLFPGRVVANHLHQGRLGDCWALASMTSLARRDPAELKDAFIKGKNGRYLQKDGTYEVRFYEHDAKTNRYHSVIQRVRPEVAMIDGKPAYASSSNPKELWISLYEKAYAAFNGGRYHNIEGGYANRAFAAMTGKKSDAVWFGKHTPDVVFAKMQRAFAHGRLLAAESHHPQHFVEGSGVVANHEYEVVGLSESNGQRFVKLRNPWGHHEPAGNGKDDGVFRLPFDKFMRLYEAVFIGG